MDGINYRNHQHIWFTIVVIIIDHDSIDILLIVVIIDVRHIIYRDTHIYINHLRIFLIALKPQHDHVDHLSHGSQPAFEKRGSASVSGAWWFPGWTPRVGAAKPYRCWRDALDAWPLDEFLGWEVDMF